MSNYDNNNKGAIWPNRKREKDTHPHFTGSLTANGVEYWVSAWKKDKDAAEKAPSLKLAITPKDEQARAMPVKKDESWDEFDRKHDEREAVEDDGEEIPF